MAAPDEYTEVRAMVAMRDGVMLATDVYLPSGPQQPLPTILIRTPCEWGLAPVPRVARRATWGTC